jgi:glutaredoxin
MDVELRERIQKCIIHNLPTSRGGLNCKEIKEVLHSIADGLQDFDSYTREQLVALLKDTMKDKEDDLITESHYEIGDSTANRFQIIGADYCEYCREAKRLTGVTGYILHPPQGAHVPKEYKYIPQIFENGRFIGGLAELKKGMETGSFPDFDVQGFLSGL